MFLCVLTQSTFSHHQVVVLRRQASPPLPVCFMCCYKPIGDCSLESVSYICLANNNVRYVCLGNNNYVRYEKKLQYPPEVDKDQGSSSVSVTVAQQCQQNQAIIIIMASTILLFYFTFCTLALATFHWHRYPAAVKTRISKKAPYRRPPNRRPLPAFGGIYI